MTDRLVSSLWLINLEPGRRRRWRRVPGRTHHPDGRRTVRELPICRLVQTVDTDRDPLDGGETANVTNLIESPKEISWSPDGKQIAFVMITSVAGPTIGKPLTKPPGATWGPDPVVIDSMHFRADGEGMDKPGFRHIFVVSVDGGAPWQLTFGPFSDAGPLAWSADGRSILRRKPRRGLETRTPGWVAHGHDLEHLSGEPGGRHLHSANARSRPISCAVGIAGRQAVAYLGYEDKRVANQNVRLNLMDSDAELLGGGRFVGSLIDADLLGRRWPQFVW